MRFAVAEMTFAPPLPTPMTYDRWMQITQSLDECIPARNIVWVCSLVSVQGDRSLCIYQVPYAEAVREAYREAGVPFRRIWQAALQSDRGPSSFPQGAVLAIAEVKSDLPVTTASDPSQQQLTSDWQAPQIQPVFSVRSLAGSQALGAFSATTETVRSLYRQLNQPLDRLWQAHFLWSPD